MRRCALQDRWACAFLEGGREKAKESDVHTYIYVICVYICVMMYICICCLGAFCMMYKTSPR